MNPRPLSREERERIKGCVRDFKDEMSVAFRRYEATCVALEQERTRLYETIRAIAVIGLGMPDPWDDAIQESTWDGPLISKRVSQLRATLAQYEAALRKIHSRMTQELAEPPSGDTNLLVELCMIAEELLEPKA